MEIIASNVSKRTKRNGKPVYVARLIFLDDDGKRREKTKESKTKNGAKDFAKEFERQFERSNGRELLAADMTFAQLADYCEKHYYKAAEYVGERKISGVRSLTTAKREIDVLRSFFGIRKLKSITHGHLRSFRDARLKMTDARIKSERENKKTISITTVNRELSKLRRMLNIAQREGWINRNPFNSGDSLISKADETQRERILTVAEETRLLEACTAERIITYPRYGKEISMLDDGSSRKHLKPILICALDTGMRQGEILTLTWKNVDFEAGRILVTAFNSKTGKARFVPISTRLENALTAIQAQCGGNGDALVFGVTSNVKRSFDLVRTLAGLENLRFHDIRHTAATRLVRSGIPLAEVGRILGHSLSETTYRYVNADDDTLRRVKDAFNFYTEPDEITISNTVN